MGKKKKELKGDKASWVIFFTICALLAGIFNVGIVICFVMMEANVFVSLILGGALTSGVFFLMVIDEATKLDKKWNR